MYFRFWGKLRCLLAVSAAVATIGLGSAEAALTRIDFSSYRDFPVVVFSDGHPEFVYASAIEAHIMPGQGMNGGGAHRAGSAFEAFLLELPGRNVRDGYYTPGPLALAQGRARQLDWNPDGIFAAASLYQAFAVGASASNPRGRLEGAALQLAIWDVLYGTGTRVNERHSCFSVLGCPELIERANAMLAWPANNAELHARGTFWTFSAGLAHGHPPEGVRGLLGSPLVPVGPVAVPESGTYAAAVFGGVLAVFALLRRAGSATA